MPPNSLEWDIWSQFANDENVKLDILLPNGYFLVLQSQKDATLYEIKADAWEAAQQCPLYGLLHDMDSYLFVCVNSTTAEQEEQVDEERRLCDLRPFQAVLRLVERKGDEREKIINSKIRVLIGKGLHEFDAQKNQEVNEFRKNMRIFCEDAVNKNNKAETWQEKLLRLRPVDIESTDTALPPYLSCKLNDDKLVISVRMEHSGSESTSKFSVSPNISCSELMDVILRKKAVNAGLEEYDTSNFVLKICGLEEYIIGPYTLSQYSYVRQMISCEKVPEFLLIPTISVKLDDELEIFETNERPRCRSEISTLSKKKKQVTISTLEVDEPFSVNVHYVHRLNCESSTKVAALLGLYHGDELLCKPIHTSETTVSEEGGECSWKETITFDDLNISNIPRTAKLCVCIYSISKIPTSNRYRKNPDNKQDTYINPVAWVNTMVFDFKGVLKSGPITLYSWHYEDDIDADVLLNPLGGLSNNPCHDQSAVITLSFKKYHEFSHLIYPSLEKILQFAETVENGNAEHPMNQPQASKSHLEQLRQICDRDPLYQLHEQEKELMWFLRNDCCTQFPSSLPKLLRCLKWNDKREVAQMTVLLQKWPRVTAVNALELLDYAYPSQEVRKYAVNCLRSMGDQEFSLYSLQLVRALKHEPYLQCDLVEFLLEQALQNKHNGHKIFWLLRSEMKFPDVSIQFGLILEAYCRGATKFLDDLSKQVEALNKLKIANELIQIEGNRRKESKEKIKVLIQELLNRSSYQESFFGLYNPLDPRYKFKKLRAEKCKFLDSKMRPLMLTFENIDSYGKDVFIIFKNGDDLRQDMLSLQMIRIMDKLWKEDGLDLRMIPYQCLATDHKIGLIEVVPNADTIANIQKEKGFTATSAFKKGSLLAWLKDHNTDEKSLNKAVEQFTLSCAGYCVVTYVLGVADRHSDNIMVKTNGQLFHIDFGHILGKFKEKFGIKRERVPFVLTHDFVYIITKGQTQKSQEFSRFQQYCEQAFTILRRKGSILISLFAMMLSTGIPELSSETDLDYLRETLVLDMTEQEALKHFRAKFDDALKSSWKTSMNWMAHNWAKDNKMAE